MALETATYLDSLVTSNPAGSDNASTADDHIRLIKACLQRTFPNIAGAVSASHSAIMHAVKGQTSVSFAASANYALSASEATWLTTVWHGVKSADQSMSSSTGLIVDADMQVMTLDPSATYRVTGQIEWSEAGGLIQILIGASGIDMERRAVVYHGGRQNTTSDNLLSVTGQNYLRVGKFKTGHYFSLTGAQKITFDGTINATATAGVYVQWSQGVSSATPTTVKKGSYIRVEKMVDY